MRPEHLQRSTCLKNLEGLWDEVTLVKGAEWARRKDFSILTEGLQVRTFFHSHRRVTSNNFSILTVELQVRTFPSSQKNLKEYNLLIACKTTYNNNL